MHWFEKTFSEWVIKHRWWLIALTVIISTTAGSGMQHLTFDNDLRAFFSEKNPQLETSRRLGDNMRISLEGWAFFDIGPDDYYLYSIRKDDFVRLQLFYYF